MSNVKITITVDKGEEKDIKEISCTGYQLFYANEKSGIVGHSDGLNGFDFLYIAQLADLYAKGLISDDLRHKAQQQAQASAEEPSEEEGATA